VIRRATVTAGILVLVAVPTWVWTNSQDDADACSTPLIAANRGSDHDTEIALYDGSGDTIRALVPDWITADPSFSPDGDEVVFVRGDDGWGEAGPAETELWIAAVDRDGPEPRNLLSRAGLRTDPAWSPAGDVIAYSERTDDYEVILRIVGTNGANPTTILAEPGADLLAPTWSPTGDAIAYIERRFDGSDYRYAVGIIDLASRDTRHVATVPDASTLSWHPDGELLLASTYALEDGEVALLDVATGSQVRVAEHATNATITEDDDVVYLTRVPSGLWQLAIGTIEDDTLVRERMVGSDEIYNYPHFGVDATSCP
jgi:Tol biopolymer transport system component